MMWGKRKSCSEKLQYCGRIWKVSPRINSFSELLGLTTSKPQRLHACSKIGMPPIVAFPETTPALGFQSPAGLPRHMFATQEDDISAWRAIFFDDPYNISNTTYPCQITVQPPTYHHPTHSQHQSVFVRIRQLFWQAHSIPSNQHHYTRNPVHSLGNIPHTNHWFNS